MPVAGRKVERTRVALEVHIRVSLRHEQLRYDGVAPIGAGLDEWGPWVEVPRLVSDRWPMVWIDPHLKQLLNELETV